MHPHLLLVVVEFALYLGLMDFVVVLTDSEFGFGMHKDRDFGLLLVVVLMSGVVLTAKS